MQTSHWFLNFFFKFPDPPHVWIESNEASEVNEGQPAALVCRWASNPTNLTDLQFTFTPDPQQSPPLPLSTSGLFQRNAHVVRLGSNAAQLTMLTIGRNQSGHYGCIAANAFGRTSTIHSVPLIVRCKSLEFNFKEFNYLLFLSNTAKSVHFEIKLRILFNNKKPICIFNFLFYLHNLRWLIN